MKTYKRINIFILTFCMCFVMILSPLSVHATSSGDTPFNVNGTSFKGFNKATKLEKFTWTVNNLSNFLASSVGLILSSSYGGVNVDGFRQSWTNFLIEKQIIADSDSMQDYLNSHMTANEDETNITVDATMSDDLHDALKQYLDSNTGWYYVQTTSYKNIDATKFVNKLGYDSLMAYCNENLDENKVLKLSSFNTVNNTFTGVSDTYIEYFVFNCDSFAGTDYVTRFQVKPYYEWVMDKEYKKYCSYSDGKIYTGDVLYEPDNIQQCQLYSTDINYPVNLFTKSGGTRKVFKSVDDMKNYSVGQQPYYASSKWQNYVGGQGNTISQQEFNAPVSYSNVVNNVNEYVTNNNGITEEQLKAILDAMLKASENGGGSSGGNSGTGLSGLLDGLGAVGEVIMAILGKLLEIVSKALTLLSDTVLNIIDKVPKGFTDLLVAIFPFIPEEWTTAIGLSLVLAVVAGIVGIFKK